MKTSPVLSQKLLCECALFGVSTYLKCVSLAISFSRQSNSLLKIFDSCIVRMGHVADNSRLQQRLFPSAEFPSVVAVLPHCMHVFRCDFLKLALTFLMRAVKWQRIASAGSRNFASFGRLPLQNSSPRRMSG